MVGTAHGVSLQSLMKNPDLVPLLGGITAVTLGDSEAKARGLAQRDKGQEFHKTVLERAV